MKSKIISFFLFLLMLILMAGLIFVGWAIYNDMFIGNAIETVHTDENLVVVDKGEHITTVQKKSIVDTITDIFTTKEEVVQDYSIEGSVGKYFYEQLSSTQKVIYNGLQESKNKLMSGTYKIEFGNKFYDILSKGNGSETLGDDYQTAIEAFTHDNADLFYIDVSKMYLNMETRRKGFKTTYNVYIAPDEGNNYYAKGFSSEYDVRIALQKIEQERDYIKSKLTGNTYKDVKKIHDYLVDNIEYDQNGESIGTYSIYGALVEKKCVCEGYTRAFKYLTDSVGIKSLIMQGTGTNTQGKTEKHAWNAVSIGGKWYLLDITWDDPVIIGRGVILQSTHYKYFLKGSRTFEKDHILEKQFTKDGKIFTYPTISISDY